jgi:hypothetical protein
VPSSGPLPSFQGYVCVLEMYRGILWHPGLA